MQNNIENIPVPQKFGRKRRFGCLQIIAIILATALLTALFTVWAAQRYLFAPDFKPVTLTAGEERQLNHKLEKFEALGSISQKSDSIIRKRGNTGDEKNSLAESDSNAPLKPEQYSEAGAIRTIRLSEREVNALLAKNTDLARKLAIDFSDNLISAKLLIPVDPDFPVLGGKTIRLRAGLHLAYRNAQPEIILRGVSVMGIPIPNAWLGGIKNIDLVKELGEDQEFSKALAEGVEDIQIEEGVLKITLKE